MTELHEHDKEQHSIPQWCAPVRPLQNKVLEGFHPLRQGYMDKLLRARKKIFLSEALLQVTVNKNQQT